MAETAQGPQKRSVSSILILLASALWLGLAASTAQAAPYAAMVMDGRTGEVLHSRNADTRLHPASLTKMMTLYITFEAVRNGELSLDQKITISRNAAAEPPSKLGLRSGQKIALRYLIRAAAVKSANDAATALGEAISGSEAAFARRMTRTAKALGMTRTTFKNAHGLTENGHMSTARDMTILGRHMLYDYPEYYNLFSRTSTHAGIKTVANTNRRLLGSYRGADGIKTGYTRAAGFNLVASAKRGDERIIATVFGGKSSATRNARVAELLDMGFKRAPSYAKLRKPARPAYLGNQGTQYASATSGGSGKTIRVSSVVKTSLRPSLRPAAQTAEVQVAEAPALDQEALKDSIDAALAEASVVAATSDLVIPASAPAPKPQLAAFTGPRPIARPASLGVTEAAAAPEPQVVTRLSTSGGRHWGINVGLFTTRYSAEKTLLRTALAEMETLDGSLRKVAKTPRGFEANFLGMTQEGAALACRRLQARNQTCETLGPS